MLMIERLQAELQGEQFFCTMEEIQMVRATAEKFVLAMVLALFVSLLPVSGFAQATSGNLSGTVTDTSGASVNGATVQAADAATSFKLSTTTINGEYRLSNLPIGRYTLTVSAPNFNTTTVLNVPVELNKTNNLNVQLKVGAVSTTVEVAGVTPAIDTTTAQLGNTYDSRVVENIGEAYTGEGVLNLSLLAPGVTSGSAMGYGTGPSVGGQRPTNNNFTLEGVDNNNKTVTGPVTQVPNDAVAEFSFLENQFSPEFGRSSGGQFNTIIKSGSNTLHGKVYEYFQNRDLNALDAALHNQKFTYVPRYDDNRYGAAIGGPIVQDKLFFFALAETEGQGQASPGTQTFCVPTAAGFTTLNSIAGLNQTNLQQFEKYTQNLPTSTGGGGTSCNTATIATGGAGTTIPLAILAVPSPNWANNFRSVGSMDYNLSSKDQVRGRWIYRRLIEINTTSADLPVFFSSTPARDHTIAISEFHTFNPHVTNELRLGFNRFDQKFPIGNYTFPGLTAFPDLAFTDMGNLQIGPNPNFPQGGTQNTYQVTNNVSWVKGRHNLKFGGEIRRTIAPDVFAQFLRGDYLYSTLSNYLFDNVPDNQAIRGFTTGGSFYGNDWAVSWFANDVFRLNSHLSLNLGVRYEYISLTKSAGLQTLNALNNVPGLITFGKPTMPTKDFMPRVGFAYSPGSSGNTSIRGGFGMSYDYYYDNYLINSLPQEAQFTVSPPVLGAPGPFLATGGITGPGGGGASTSKAATAEWIPTSIKAPYSVNWNLGVQHVFKNVWTVSLDYVGTHGVDLPIQERIDIQTLVSPTATGFLPTFLTGVPSPATIAGLTTTLQGLRNGSGAPFGCGAAQQAAQLCQILPAFYNAGFTGAGGITSELPFGWSKYHGADISVNRRFTNGLQLISSYTWSHNIDNSDATLATTALNPRRPQDFFNLAAEKGPSLLDRRNRIVAAAIYELPFFKESHGLAKTVLGGWQVSPTYVFESPQYATALSGIVSVLNGNSGADRAIYNPSGIPGTSSAAIAVCAAGLGAACTAATTVGYVPGLPAGGPNVLAGSTTVPCTSPSTCGQFIQTGLGALSNLGRNTIPLPRTDNINFSVSKNIKVSERMNFQFVAQAFNLFNHPQYIAGNLYDVSLTNGLINATGFVYATGATNKNFDRANTQFSSNPRNMVLALKLNF